MHIPLRFTRLAVICAVAIAFITQETTATHMVACSNIGQDRSCSLGSNVETVAVIGNRVLVGVSNAFYSFNWNLSVVYEVSLTPDMDRHSRCFDYLKNQLEDCVNVITFIQQIPSSFKTNAVDEEQVLVCGSNTYFPKCTIHELASLSNYSFMTSHSREDVGYSIIAPAVTPQRPIAILASNGRFFSAGHILNYYDHRATIGMAKNPLGGDSLFSVRGLHHLLWFNDPEFISTYEIGEYVYFFMRERAYEEERCQSVIYSRVIRICKSDNGQDSSNENTPFLTYQKARIKCSVGERKGSISYNYDNLESTFLLNKSGQPSTLYGIFSSPENGPKGSAICKFSFDRTETGSLTQGFQEGHYRTLKDIGDGNSPWTTETPGPFSCPGDSSGRQRTVEQARRCQLVDGEAVDHHPLHRVDGEKLSKIAVDVISFNGSVQEIVYYSTESGEIHQAVYVRGPDGISRQLQDHILLELSSTVTYLNVYCINLDTQHWQVYATAGKTIATITRGDCLTQYNESCIGCLDSRDPYCVWSTDLKVCINKVSQVSHGITGLYEAISVTEDIITSDNVCGSRPTPQQ